MSNILPDPTQMQGRDFNYWLRGLLDGCSGKPSQQQWDLIVKHVRRLINQGVTQPYADVPMMLWGFIQVNSDEYPDDHQWTAIIEKCYEFFDQLPQKVEQDVAKKVEAEAERLSKQAKDQKDYPVKGGVIPEKEPIYYAQAERRFGAFHIGQDIAKSL